MLEMLQLPFVQRALLSGMLVGATLSLVGIFVVLRKSAFFGDAVAHFTFTGIALGFLLGIDPIIGALFIATLFSFGIIFIQNRSSRQSLDSLIGIFFSGAAALGIFIIGMLKGYNPDLFQYLFGDIIAISEHDVLFSLVTAIIAIIVILVTWKQLFKITFNREIAHVAGLNVALYDYIFMGLLAIITAVSIKIVGIILVPALLVIPAASSKNIATTFKSLITYSMLFAIISVIAGLLISLYLDTASGATIVLSSIAIFILTLFKRR